MHIFVYDALFCSLAVCTAHAPAGPGYAAVTSRTPRRLQSVPLVACVTLSADSVSTSCRRSSLLHLPPLSPLRLHIPQYLVSSYTVYFLSYFDKFLLFLTEVFNSNILIQNYKLIVPANNLLFKARVKGLMLGNLSQLCVAISIDFTR